MEFTYASYKHLIQLLGQNGYPVKNYHDFEDAKRCVILRHDIDNSLERALCLGRVEETLHVSSTYFVLLSSEFYNVAARRSREMLLALRDMGHEIGLHFDETAYGEITVETMPKYILREAAVLSDILEMPITTVSMHRPSKATLEAGLTLPGMVNSYGKTFFHDFKYLSDSRRRWREPVESIIRSGEYDRLHILTHAFWYHDQEEPIETTVGEFIRSANRERYHQMLENITDLPSILKEDELFHEDR